MDSSPLPSAELIAAFGAFLGSVLSGAIALVAELRRPLPALDDDPVKRPTMSDEVLAALAEECDHLNRTIWLVEKRLSEEIRRLHAGSRERDP